MMFSLASQSKRADSKSAARPVFVRHQRTVSADADSHPLSKLSRSADKNSGAELPVSLQEAWSPRLGHDLSSIRIHHDAESSQAVKDSGVNALSLGPDLFFAAGRLDLNSPAGLRLLGHEVVHAAQAGMVRGTPPQRLLARPGGPESETETEADRVGAVLSGVENGPAQVGQRHQAPQWAGDKKISFSGKNITVSDTYVLYGPGFSTGFLERFRRALNKFYNTPSFSYRGYQVKFNLSVREARYRTVTRERNMRYGETSSHTETQMVDSGSDPDTKLFNVKKGSGDEGGFFTISLYETSTEAVIAHEVGHYLSDRIGWRSERYRESLGSRLRAVVGMSGRAATPEPGCEGDIMASVSGTETVTACLLGDTLDKAINRYEQGKTP